VRLLLVEDDTAAAQAIELLVQSEGYVCDSTDLGEDGLEIGKLYDYDLIILDLMLPDIDGLDVLRRMRASKVQTPILILSGLTQPEHKVKALTAGADDYLSKPFDRDELIARIQAIVRRYNGHSDAVIRTGNLSIDLDSGTVMLGGKRIYFTRREASILELFALRMGSTVTKDMIMSHLYNGMDEPGIRTVDVFISKMRKKLSSAGGDNYIETVWGRGYQLCDLAPTETPGNDGIDEDISRRRKSAVALDLDPVATAAR
jgi:two-component system cell cycle response regulator CtrA